MFSVLTKTKIEEKIITQWLWEGKKIELSDIKKKKQFKYTEKFEIQTKSIVNEKGEINSVKPDA